MPSLAPDGSGTVGTISRGPAPYVPAAAAIDLGGKRCLGPRQAYGEGVTSIAVPNGSACARRNTLRGCDPSSYSCRTVATSGNSPRNSTYDVPTSGGRRWVPIPEDVTERPGRERPRLRIGCRSPTRARGPAPGPFSVLGTASCHAVSLSPASTGWRLTSTASHPSLRRFPERREMTERSWDCVRRLGLPHPAPGREGINRLLSCCFAVGLQRGDPPCPQRNPLRNRACFRAIARS